jgi:hypothetical protein
MKTSSPIAILLLAVQAMMGCGGRSSSTSPVGPSPVPLGAGEPLTGYVFDTAFRPVGDVRIEILDGPLAGQTIMSTAAGLFDYPGTVIGAVTFRATKPGYVTATASSRSNGGGRSFVSFVLDVDAPPVQIAGDYSLTFIPDAACVDRLPKNVPPLTFAATIAPPPGGTGRPDTQLTLSIQSTNALTFNSFPIGIAGNVVALFAYNGEDPGLVESLPPTGYLTISGTAQATISPSSPAEISAPFDGTIGYCDVGGAGNPYNDCYRPGSTHLDCTSKNNRLILTRR